MKEKKKKCITWYEKTGVFIYGRKVIQEKWRIVYKGACHGYIANFL